MSQFVFKIFSICVVVSICSLTCKLMGHGPADMYPSIDRFWWIIIFRDEMTEALDPVEDNPEFKNGVGAEQKPAVPCESGLKWFLTCIYSTSPPLGLLRLFYSELFDASMAVQYLFKSRDAGILQFLGNRLFELDPKDLDFYLPQLLILYLYTEEPTRNCIHPYLVKRYFSKFFLTNEIFWFQV